MPRSRGWTWASASPFPPCPMRRTLPMRKRRGRSWCPICRAIMRRRAIVRIDRSRMAHTPVGHDSRDLIATAALKLAVQAKAQHGYGPAIGVIGRTGNELVIQCRIDAGAKPRIIIGFDHTLVAVTRQPSVADQKPKTTRREI